MPRPALSSLLLLVLLAPPLAGTARAAKPAEAASSSKERTATGKREAKAPKQPGPAARTTAPAVAR